jgi:hypothetical protein
LAGLLATLLFPARAMAQSTSFGVEGGINVADIAFTSNDPAEFNPTFESRIGAVVGVFVARDFNPVVGLQVDALYSQKGAKATVFEPDIGANINLDARIDFLEIPVLVRATARASDAVAVRFFGGPAFGIKLSDKVTLNDVELPEDEVQLKSFDVGLTAGAAVQLGKFFVDGRYTWGLVNLDDDPTGQGDDIKSRVFTVMVGVAFN